MSVYEKNLAISECSDHGWEYDREAEKFFTQDGRVVDCQWIEDTLGDNGGDVGKAFSEACSMIESPPDIDVPQLEAVNRIEGRKGSPQKGVAVKPAKPHTGSHLYVEFHYMDGKVFRVDNPQSVETDDQGNTIVKSGGKVFVVKDGFLAMSYPEELS